VSSPNGYPWPPQPLASIEPEGLNFSTPITVDLPSEVSFAEGGTYGLLLYNPESCRVPSHISSSPATVASRTLYFTSAIVFPAGTSRRWRAGPVSQTRVSEPTFHARSGSQAGQLLGIVLPIVCPR
jgi:hypothetical protein